MAISRLDILIDRFRNGTIEHDEHDELLQLLSQPAHARQAKKFFKEIMERQPENALHFNAYESHQLYEEIEGQILQEKQPSMLRSFPIMKWAGIAAAASVLIMFGYSLFQKAPEVKPQVAEAQKAAPDFLPGKKNKAVLILADNSQIVLDSTNAGLLGTQGNAMITKAANGEIIYEHGNVPHGASEPVYNILEIPVGAEYQLVLADGTKVWLNSESRLKFPVSFSGNSREVEVSGEAYFEIAQNKSKPFKVRFNEAAVEVLGTHFNVNAYSSENNQAVTLLQGSVKVVNTGKEVLIKPGQQARLAGNGNINVKEVDTEEAVAWKNGYFMFVDEDIKSIMKKLSRWYGFTAEYQGNVDGEHFGGMISRYKKISEVLSMFERTGTIKFKLIQGDQSGKGRKLIISK